MGLDSVELLVSFETYFEISVPDKEAETIYTVRDLCDSVCRHLSITASHTTLRDDVFATLKKALQTMDYGQREINLNDLVKKFFTLDRETI